MTRWLSAILLLLMTAGAAAATAAPEDILKSKGLTKVGATYLLEADIKLPERLRAMRVIKHRVDQHAAQRIKLEREIERARGTVLHCARVSAELADSLPAARAQGVARHNQVVAEIRAVDSAQMEAANYIQETQKELAKLADPSDDYISAIVDVATRMETIAQQYEALAADEQVKTALAAINARGGLKVRLGPSNAYISELPGIRKQRELVKGSVVKLFIQGGTPHANVVINGKVGVPMTVDTGAALVTLTAESGRKLGLKLDATNPRLKITTADGKTTEGWIVTLQSVRLGQFLVENVEAFVFPANVAGSDLLGGTFLRNFVCRLDIGAMELHMSQVAGAPAAGKAQDENWESALEKHDRVIQEAKESYQRAVLGAKRELLRELPEALRKAKPEDVAKLEAAKKEAEDLLAEANFKASGGVRVQINAADDWKEVMTVYKGQRFKMKGEGTWLSDAKDKNSMMGLVGKDGVGLLELKIGDLVNRATGNGSFAAPFDGSLMVRIYDEHRQDNSGSVTLTITREE